MDNSFSCDPVLCSEFSWIETCLQSCERIQPYWPTAVLEYLLVDESPMYVAPFTVWFVLPALSVV